MSKESTQDMIGKILTAEAERDAIHIAVAPVVAACQLVPGAPIGLNEQGQADLTDKTIGIVDPFLKRPVKRGDRFFLFLYPNTATGLRHVYTHPVLDAKEVQDRSASEKWLREFAEEIYHDYDDRPDFDAYAKLLEQAEEGYFCLNSQPDWLYQEGATEKQEMWRHLEIVRGRPFGSAHVASASFSCSC